MLGYVFTKFIIGNIYDNTKGDHAQNIMYQAFLQK